MIYVPSVLLLPMKQEFCIFHTALCVSLFYEIACIILCIYSSRNIEAKWISIDRTELTFYYIHMQLLYIYSLGEVFHF